MTVGGHRVSTDYQEAHPVFNTQQDEVVQFLSQPHPPPVVAVRSRALVHPRPHPGTPGDTTSRTPAAAPNVRAGGVPSPIYPPYGGRPSQRSPPGAPRPAVRHPSPSPNRVGRSPRTRPGRRLGPGQPGAGTVRRSLRHRPDPRIPPSCGHHHRMARRDLGLPHQQPPPWSYAASLTGSPTPTTTPPEQSSSHDPHTDSGNTRSHEIAQGQQEGKSYVRKHEGWSQPLRSTKQSESDRGTGLRSIVGQET